MPRRSSAALAIAPQPIERVERLYAPHELTVEQAKVWTGIVSGHPADWFAAGAVPVLMQLCRHVVISNRLSHLIDHTSDNNKMLSYLKELRAESDIIRKLASSLRITPQSLTNHNGNKKQFDTIDNPWSHNADAC
jgi:hypothetical protein